MRPVRAPEVRVVRQPDVEPVQHRRVPNGPPIPRLARRMNSGPPVVTESLVRERLRRLLPHQVDDAADTAEPVQDGGEAFEDLDTLDVREVRPRRGGGHRAAIVTHSIPQQHVVAEATDLDPVEPAVGEHGVHTRHVGEG